mgnify:CR=1 FL=1
MKDIAEILVAAGLTIMASLAAGMLFGLIAAVAYNTFKALV